MLLLLAKAAVNTGKHMISAHLGIEVSATCALILEPIPSTDLPFLLTSIHHGV